MGTINYIRKLINRQYAFELNNYLGVSSHRQDFVDKLYFSSDTGLAKPDPRAFEIVLKENNLKPEEVIYFDDSKNNVAAAEALGIESHLYTTPERVRELLG